MRVLDVPRILAAAGLNVVEVAGWRTRGSNAFGPVKGITCHHTGGSVNSTDAGEIGVLVNGRKGLPGPIAQLYLNRAGRYHVVASGRCNHNLIGWGGPNEGLGNTNLIGIEAQHSGGEEPWHPRQYEAYVRGVAALCAAWGIPAGKVAGHKEHQPGAKFDPTFNMATFRTNVRAVLAHPPEGDELNDDQARMLEEIHRTSGNADRYLWRGVMTLDEQVEGIAGRTGLATVPNLLATTLDTVTGRLDELERQNTATLAKLDEVLARLGTPTTGNG